MTLPEVIPIFPLPNVVLFPRMPLPLHVFEPRYRDLVRDALRGPRLIGMVLLRGDWQQDYHGRPPIFAVGTVGEMVHVDELADGRSNIVLRGLREFHVQDEVGQQSYREVRVVWRAPDTTALPGDLRATIVDRVRRYLEGLGTVLGSPDVLEPSVDGETFVNFFAQHLELAPIEKQSLLEAPTLADRARSLIDVLEFRLEERRAAPGLPSGRTQ